MLIRLFAVVLAALLGMPAALAATILVYGDSLSAGYGVPRNTDWAHLLQLRLREKKTDYTVVNASISGETTLGGANRIDDALRNHRPAITIVALGANDGLRGSDLKAMRSNLERIIDAARRAKSQVILVGMQIPPNYGQQYTEKFRDTYRDVARAKRVALVPFLLEGFADKRDLFQADNLHPAEQAQPLMLETIWKTLGPLIKVK
jgi:acyl-CoA thioesterase-1